MSKVTQAVLLVADISGYTRFVKYHAVSISHAKQITVRLLKALIKASKSPLKVAELEGDAVFFYAIFSEKDLEKTIAQVKSQIIQLFNSFYDEINVLSNIDACSCEACINVGDLKLKQVVHIGTIDSEKINKSVRLFGLDVIVVHRMLKNSVPSHEYVMMTDHAHSNFVDFYGLEPKTFREHFEGIGEMDTLVFYLDEIRNKIEFEEFKKESFSFKERMNWKIKLTYDTFLDLFRIKRIRGTFNNIPS